jgi:hypothetical protein
MLFVDAHKRTERLHTCRECEHYVAKTKSCGPLVTEAFTDSPLCGCYLPAKTKLKVSSCPLGKWEATVTDEDIETIREFVNRDNSKRTMEELTALATKHLGKGQKASSCPSCNRKLLDQLKTLLNNADSQT